MTKQLGCILEDIEYLLELFALEIYENFLFQMYETVTIIACSYSINLCQDKIYGYKSNFITIIDIESLLTDKIGFYMFQLTVIFLTNIYYYFECKIFTNKNNYFHKNAYQNFI